MTDAPAMNVRPIEAEQPAQKIEIQQPSVSDQLRSYKRGGQLKIDVGGMLTEMEKAGALQDPRRLSELAKMDSELLRKQPEYTKLQESYDAEEVSLGEETDGSSGTALLPELEEMKNSPELQGKTTSEVMTAAEEKKAEEIEKQMLAKIEAEQNSAATADQKTAVKVEAKLTARAFVEQFLVRASLMMGNYAGESIRESSFSTFLANFVKGAENRGAGWNRYRDRQSSAEGRPIERVSLFQVEQFLKLKRNTTAMLSGFYLEMKKSDQASEFSQKLETNEKAVELTKEELKATLELVFKRISGEKSEKNKPLLELSLATAMGKREPKDVVVDDRFFLMIEEVATKDDAFESFYSNFTDVKPS